MSSTNNQKKTDNQIEETHLILSTEEDFESKFGTAKDHLDKLVKAIDLLRSIDLSEDEVTGYENCLFVIFDLGDAAKRFLRGGARFPRFRRNFAIGKQDSKED